MHPDELKDDPTWAWLQATNAVGNLNRKLKQLVGERRSKHMQANGIKATKRYADGRQKANPRPMRKRK